MYNGTHRLQVRDLDGRRYILGTMVEGADDYRLHSAVLVNVAGSTFAQIRALGLESSKEYRYVRVSLYDDDTLSFREVDPNFFSGDRQFNNPTELRLILATNIDNPGMYREDAWIGTRLDKHQ